MPRGQKPSKFTKAQIIDALQKTGGLISQAAKLLSATYKHQGRTITTSGLSKWCIRHAEEIAEIRAQAREEVLDWAEWHIAKKVRAGNNEMIKFFMLNQGRGRGYGKVLRLTGPDGEPIMPQAENPAASTPDFASMTPQELEDWLAAHMAGS